MISAIFAVDGQGGIGKNGTLPWPKHSEDLQWFKRATFGHIVVMGGNTWRDPMMPKPLPGRLNVVVTSKNIDIPGVMVLNTDYKTYLTKMAKSNIDRHIFIIGGASLLLDCRDLLDQIVLTRFNENYGCDVSINIDTYLKDFVLDYSNKTESAEYTIWKKNI